MRRQPEMLVRADGEAMAPTVDLLTPVDSFSWTAGAVHGIPVRRSIDVLSRWAGTSSADYFLLSDESASDRLAARVKTLIDEGVDLAHCGLDDGSAGWMPELDLVIQDWSMIVRRGERCTTWKASPSTLFGRRTLVRDLGGFDAIFQSDSAAAFDFGYRALKAGALVEYRPELLEHRSAVRFVQPPTLEDTYSFVLRHYGARWGKYLAARHSVTSRRAEHWAALRDAETRCARYARPSPPEISVCYDKLASRTIHSPSVSVIIPTIGRYPYLPAALESIAAQTIAPAEIIVVDQNAPGERQPDVYRPFSRLPLRIIWEREAGQSLARNAGLAAAKGEYVLLFDDDSIARPDLIEAHAQWVCGGRFDASTGVAQPPENPDADLPPGFRHKRVAQTFDSGNAFLPLTLAKDIGGFDRHYDKGPGADADFGTRLYLHGARILHNPAAQRVHFKAPTGGLRRYHSYKYNTDLGLFKAFPPVTQNYYALRFLTRRQHRERVMLQFATSKLPRRAERRKPTWTDWARLALTSFVLPLKFGRSYVTAWRMFRSGPRLKTFCVNRNPE